MTQLIKPDDPRYFQQTSDEPYDRHNYKVVLINGQSVVVDAWDLAQAIWFQQPGQFLSHIEVLDKDE
jgi:hypothetical protein|tara:strand:- start:3653 stop:3853 length:201 start_codon:yes stop_codon:yes gene_type:complete